MSEQTGKLIVLEGLDGSGKSVQFGLLRDYLVACNIPVQTVDFPDYDGSIFGRLVGRYLNGEFGDVYEVSPYVSSMFYAGDRLESRDKVNDWLQSGKLVLANRYVGSNQAYHSAKLPPKQRPAFLEWLNRLEFEANLLPRPALNLFLHVPVETSSRMIGQREKRIYTTATYDIHERNGEYLAAVAEQYLQLCQTEVGWQRLDVTDATGNLLAREVIHKQIVQALVVAKILDKGDS